MANEIGVTETSASAQSLVSSIVQDTLKERSQLLATVRNFSGQGAPGASQISIPRRNQFSAADKSENTDLSNQEMTFASDVLAFDKHKAIRATIEDIAKIQSNVDVVAEVVREQAAELALQVDKDILAQLKLCSASTPDHKIPWNDTTNDDLELADITMARKLLRDQSLMFDNDDYFMVISPAKERELLSISEVISAEKYGDRTLYKGEVGKILGFRILVSNLLGAKESLFYHRNHAAYASQAEPKFEKQRKPESLGDQYVVSMLYGCKVLDSGKRGVFVSDAHE